MIDLRINNQSLDLYPDTSISMEENSSVFSSDVMPGSFSMPFTIPASANNSRLLGFPEMLNLKEKPKLRYAAELIVEGVPYLSGEVIFRGFGDDKYKINFQSQLSLVNQYFQEMKLSDLLHEDIVLTDYFTPSHRVKVVAVNLNWDRRPTTLRVKINDQEFEQEFVTGWRDELTTKVDNADIGVELYIFPTIIFPPEGGVWQQFYFRAKTNGIDERVEVDLYDDAEDPVWQLNSLWSQGDYKTDVEAAIQALKTNTLANADFVFPTFHNPGFYEKEEGRFSGVFNEYVNGSFVFTHLQGDRSSFVPMFSLDYVFRKIHETTGVKLVGDFVNHPDIKKLIFFNNHSLDYFEKSLPAHPTYTYYDRIFPQNHLPDMTINELLLQLSRMFSIGFDFNNDAKELTLSFRKQVVENDNFIDITNKVNPSFELNYDQSDGYTLSYKWSSKDVKFNPEAPGIMTPIIVGDGKEKIELKLHTTYMHSSFQMPASPIVGGLPYIPSLLKIPAVNQPGTWAKQEPNGEGRLLFFYGMQKDFLMNDYPFASSDNISFKKDVLGEFSLELPALYENNLKAWLEFLAIGQTITREAYWGIIDLLNHNEKQKYRIDQIRYLIKRISYSVSTRKGLGPVKLEMLKAE